MSLLRPVPRLAATLLLALPSAVLAQAAGKKSSIQLPSGVSPEMSKRLLAQTPVPAPAADPTEGAVPPSPITRPERRQRGGGRNAVTIPRPQNTPGAVPAPVTPQSTAAIEAEREQTQAIADANTLNKVLIQWADDHDGKYPDTLEPLVAEQKLTRELADKVTDFPGAGLVRAEAGEEVVVKMKANAAGTRAVEINGSGAIKTTGTPVPPSSVPPPAGAVTPPNPAVPNPAVPANPFVRQPRETPGNGAAPAAAELSESGMDMNEEWPTDITFSGQTFEEVIVFYEGVTGRHVIRDPALAAGTVIIQSNPEAPRKLTRGEAADFIKASLMMQGAVIQYYSKNVDKAIALNRPPLVDPPREGAKIYHRPEDLPDTDEAVNYVMRLNYLSAQDAATILQTVAPTHTWGKSAIIPSSNALLIQDSVGNVRSILAIMEKADIEPVKQEHEFVQLERAGAAEVEQLITAILQAQTQNASQRAGGGGGRGTIPIPQVQPGQPNQPAAVAGNTSGAAGTGTMPDGNSVIIKSDERTNRIFVNGPRSSVDYIVTLIKQFDEASKVKNLVTVNLRYIPVNEFINLAAQALEARGGQSQSQGGAGGGASTTGNARRIGEENFGSRTGGGNRAGTTALGGNSRTGSTSAFGGGGSTSAFGGGGGGGFGGGGAGGGAAGSGTPGQVDERILPQAVTVGKTLLISNPANSSLIVSGPPESIDRVTELLRELDQPPMQVHINAVIAEVTLGDDLTTGLDILRRVEDVQVGGQDVSFAGLYRAGGGGTFIDPALLDNIAAFPAGGGGLNLWLAAGELFNASVRALESTNRAKVISNPHVMTFNSVPATLQSGNRVPYTAGTQNTVVSGGTTSLNSNIDYIDADLTLSVTPLVNSRDQIKLTISQQNNNITGFRDFGNGNSAPQVSTQSLTTEIIVPNGAIIPIGGIITENQTEDHSSVPILAQIPVLKSIFGSNTVNKSRRELLILVQPRIIDTGDDLVDYAVHEIQRTVVGPEAQKMLTKPRDISGVQLPVGDKEVPFKDAGYTPQQIQQRQSRGGFLNRIGNAVKGD